MARMRPTCECERISFSKLCRAHLTEGHQLRVLQHLAQLPILLITVLVDDVHPEFSGVVARPRHGKQLRDHSAERRRRLSGVIWKQLQDHTPNHRLGGGAARGRVAAGGWSTGVVHADRAGCWRLPRLRCLPRWWLLPPCALALGEACLVRVDALVELRLSSCKLGRELGHSRLRDHLQRICEHATGLRGCGLGEHHGVEWQHPSAPLIRLSLRVVAEAGLCEVRCDAYHQRVRRAGDGRW